MMILKSFGHDHNLTDLRYLKSWSRCREENKSSLHRHRGFGF